MITEASSPALLRIVQAGCKMDGGDTQILIEVGGVDYDCVRECWWVESSKRRV